MMSFVEADETGFFNFDDSFFDGDGASRSVFEVGYPYYVFGGEERPAGCLFGGIFSLPFGLRAKR
jgi:hypothetical protein